MGRAWQLGLRRRVLGRLFTPPWRWRWRFVPPCFCLALGVSRDARAVSCVQIVGRLLALVAISKKVSQNPTGDLTYLGE